ncbi:hypothetical protein [Candidatus Methanarcanum hacksteinii]|uniref:hypothetical protein n=1 Tax=Candidatus Methanarcanum hacksteinii TaxID=2911857 RepID=UPI0037DDB107
MNPKVVGFHYPDVAIKSENLGIVYATPTPDVPVPPITPGDDNNTIVNVTKEGTNQNVTFMAAIATMVASLLLLAVVIKRK